MRDKELKIKKEDCFRRIKEANDELALIRSECKHLETEKCNYMCPPGYIEEDTTICSICGEWIKSEEDKYWESYLLMVDLIE